MLDESVARFGGLTGARALLVGTASYTGLPDIPAVATTLADLADTLERRCGLPAEAIRVATDLPTPMELGDVITSVTEDATGPLLVYFAGHGLLSRDGVVVIFRRDFSISAEPQVG
ncbi:hypothetical protein [Microtetraspora sp. NBRC 13810]|uniref:hypothetical protein n=1 Tax=Microtetraspora sp. NBRC 13810 TaxID=3030990 RepID=UPI002553973F|nr:hypothetical protein [Microtetraspora sp. NBRC 13810]